MDKLKEEEEALYKSGKVAPITYYDNKNRRNERRDRLNKNPDSNKDVVDPYTEALNKNWCVHGDELDLDDGGNKNKYDRELQEFSFDRRDDPLYQNYKIKGVGKDKKDFPQPGNSKIIKDLEGKLENIGDKFDPNNMFYDNGKLIYDTSKRHGYGNIDSYKGYYRVMAFREADAFEWDRS